MSGFQTSVNQYPAPGLEGAFADANPYASMIAGDSALTAGSAGVVVGRMAWARNDNGVVSNGHPGVPSRLGYVSRYQVVLITTWLAAASFTIQSGLDMTLHDGGDFWARFPAGAGIGQKVFASYADGSLSAHAAAATVAGFAGTITTVNANATITVNTVSSGAIALGQPVTSANVPANAVIGSFGTGTGGTGTYGLVDATTGAPALATSSAGPTAATTLGALETRWYVHSVAAATELAKISTRGLN